MQVNLQFTIWSDRTQIQKFIFWWLHLYNTAKAQSCGQRTLQQLTRFYGGRGGWFGYQGTDNTRVFLIMISPPDVKNRLIGKDSDAGKDWRQEEKGTTEDEMFGWHHRLDGHEFEQALGAGEGQGSLACCRPWGCKESDTTELLNWTEHHSAFIKTHSVQLKESIWLYPS